MEANLKAYQVWFNVDDLEEDGQGVPLLDGEDDVDE